MDTQHVAESIAGNVLGMLDAAGALRPLTAHGRGALMRDVYSLVAELLASVPSERELPSEDTQEQLLAAECLDDNTMSWKECIPGTRDIIVTCGSTHERRVEYPVPHTALVMDVPVDTERVTKEIRQAIEIFCASIRASMAR